MFSSDMRPFDGTFRIFGLNSDEDDACWLSVTSLRRALPQSLPTSPFILDGFSLGSFFTYTSCCCCRRVEKLLLLAFAEVVDIDDGPAKSDVMLISSVNSFAWRAVNKSVVMCLLRCDGWSAEDASVSAPNSDLFRFRWAVRAGYVDGESR